MMPAMYFPKEKVPKGFALRGGMHKRLSSWRDEFCLEPLHLLKPYMWSCLCINLMLTMFCTYTQSNIDLVLPEKICVEWTSAGWMEMAKEQKEGLVHQPWTLKEAGVHHLIFTILADSAKEDSAWCLRGGMTKHCLVIIWDENKLNVTTCCYIYKSFHMELVYFCNTPSLFPNYKVVLSYFYNGNSQQLHNNRYFFQWGWVNIRIS